MPDLTLAAFARLARSMQRNNVYEEPHMDTTSRFMDLKPPENPVLLIGAGTIGSYTAIALAKAGFGMYIYDHDVVEPGNVGVQAYIRQDVGVPKATALYTQLAGSIPEHNFSVGTYNTRYTMGRGSLNDIFAVILAVDSIEERRNQIRPLTNTGNTRTIIVDPRMSFDTVEVHMVTHNPDVETPWGLAESKLLDNYKSCLFDPTQPYAEEACGSRAHPGAGMLCASIISSGLLAAANGKPYPYLTMGSLSTHELTAYWRDGDEKKARELG